MIEVAVERQAGDFNLKLAFSNGEGITALFGRSGSGKSMTIALIAGLARPDRGHIVLDGRRLVDTQAKIFVPPHRRRIGLVFQDAYLFPHLSVRQNLLFGRWFAPRKSRRIAFDAVVDTLGIGALLTRRPGLLSGGERQRIAIGRAVLACPELLLFDEPLAALDMERKLEILPLIERLRDEFAIPIVYVSHAVEEVMRLADKVVVLESGHVKMMGTPADVFGPAALKAPEMRFGRSSVLTARVVRVDDAYGLTELQHSAGVISLVGPVGPVGRAIRIVVRATDVTLSLRRPERLSVRSVLCGRIELIETEGAFAIVDITLDGGGRLFATTTRRSIDELGLDRGAPVFALVKTVALDERAIAQVPF